MSENEDETIDLNLPKCIAVTGMSGAGRNTALNVLEDCGYHRIDNLPPKLLERIFADPLDMRPLALGFGALEASEYGELEKALEIISKKMPFELLFIDASDDILMRRFSETRRKHPVTQGNELHERIDIERKLLGGLRARADVMIDSSSLGPHDMKRELRRIFNLENDVEFRIQVKSFSYKRGVPRDADLVFDCRFLKNPHWDENLRPLDGRNVSVLKYIETDPLYHLYLADIGRMLEYVIPAARKEGRSYFTVCFGCSGGRHRSVAMAENILDYLNNYGWRTTIAHRELPASTNKNELS